MQMTARKPEMGAFLSDPPPGLGSRRQPGPLRMKRPIRSDTTYPIVGRALGAVVTIESGTARTAEACRPVFTILENDDGSWLVRRPGSPVEQGFATFQDAVAFVRSEIRSGFRIPVAVEAWIGDFCFGGRFDPKDVGSLFGVGD